MKLLAEKTRSFRKSKYSLSLFSRSAQRSELLMESEARRGGPGLIRSTINGTEARV